MNDKIIKFPGARNIGPGDNDYGRATPPAPTLGAIPQPGEMVPAFPEPQAPIDKPEIMKALNLLQAAEAGAMSFIIVGIKPTPSGADFFTECLGNADDIRNAEDHLPRVIGKLLARKGIR